MREQSNRAGQGGSMKISADDLVLIFQRAIDRFVRRLRRGAPLMPTHRRFLIVQIDGLSRVALEQGLASGRMPFVKRMLERDGYRMEPMSVSLPTSTPAFQMATFYGVRPDIPGFHYYSRDRQGDIHFPRSGHAAWVETRQASGRRGILQGGSAYGCCFTGGADNNLFTFASLTRASGRGVLSALSPFVVVTWVAGKNVAFTVRELAREGLRRIAGPRQVERGWRWVKLKIFMSIWVRNFFTMAVSRDLYEGVPAIYVNYLGYDEVAHRCGPGSDHAMQALHELDQSIEQLWTVMRRVPEHRYDAYILADHGQSACTPFSELTHGKRLERWIFDGFLHPERAGEPGAARVGLWQGLRERQAETRGMIQRFMNYLDEDYLRCPDPEAHERDGVRAISAGPNAFLYVKEAKEPLDAAAVEERFPGLAERLSRSLGIGFVLVRSANGNGPLCWWRGQHCELSPTQPGPFAGREDAALVVEGIENLMQMRSAGDLVIYGTDSPDGDVSFIREHGAHAGPGASEMHTFIVGPAKVTLPSPISHPVQLYEHFIRYQQT
jgi:Type I phosphodiesterase / nucleotide pyrophosphatase